MNNPYDYSMAVNTKIFEAGLIEQEVNIMGEVYRNIFRTQDDQFIQTMKELGWCSPSEVAKLESKIYKLECDLIDALNAAWGVNP